MRRGVLSVHEPSVLVNGWTEADEAEWVALLTAFVHGAKNLPPGPWPPDVRDTFAQLIEWRTLRARISHAEWLRHEQG